ncbi:hypothetical protein ACHAWC_003176, partial [Mediolabrus comicus]
MMDASAVFSFILLLLTARCSFALLFSPSGGCWCHPKTFRQQLKRGRSKYTSNLYNNFHNYAWEKMHYDDDKSLLSTVPDRLKTNSSPVKGSPDGTSVVASIRSISELQRSSEDAPAAQAQAQAIRLARSAFLETQTSSSEALISPMTIHVLNLVLFPATHIRDPSTNAYIGLPIFGADIVTLPGNKHLVALDFQPVLPLNEKDGSTSRNSLFPERYSHFETKLKLIHTRYQNNDTPSEALLPWGGDIPPQAIRWFSPYALWTRLGDEKAIEIVSTTVWDAYREYVDLYFELIDAVQSDLDNGNLNIIIQKEAEEEDVVGREEEGHKKLASSNP